MKLKSKLMMAVMAVVFLAAGSAWATPVIPFEVTYTATEVDGGWDLNFTITNSMNNDYNKGVKNIFLSVGDSADTTNTDWSASIGSWQFSSSNNPDTTYVVWFRDTTKPYEFDGGDTYLDFIVTVALLPREVSFVIQANGSTDYYPSNTGFFGTSISPCWDGKATQVPEPATLILLGLSLIGLAGVRKNR